MVGLCLIDDYNIIGTGRAGRRSGRRLTPALKHREEGRNARLLLALNRKAAERASVVLAHPLEQALLVEVVSTGHANERGRAGRRLFQRAHADGAGGPRRWRRSSLELGDCGLRGWRRTALTDADGARDEVVED
eukprot:scaffold54927_cov31-Tisochrysis_lutea.AAC.3